MEQTQARWGRRVAGQPAIIGHRGASAVATENTVEAFARAAADGADGVELDVLLCRSGEAVVFHDDDLSRLAGRAGRIAELPLAELREVRLTTGGRISTLEEALEACGPRLLVNVELKAPRLFARGGEALVAAVDEALTRTASAPRVLISSFSPHAVARWMARRRAVPAALLFEAAASLPLRRAWALPLLRPFAVHPEHLLCAPNQIAAWHAAGYSVHAWTVDDAPRLRALAAAGVDGLITNDPASARRALAAQ